MLLSVLLYSSKFWLVKKLTENDDNDIVYVSIEDDASDIENELTFYIYSGDDEYEMQSETQQLKSNRDCFYGKDGTKLE